MYKQVLKPFKSDGQVLAYQPKSLGQGVPSQVLSFVKNPENPDGGAFEINSLVASNTGLTELEKKNFQNRLEEEVLGRLKGIEEKAYAEAYALGLQDGRQKAFEEANTTIQGALNNLAQVVENLAQIKKKLLVDNEKQIVLTIFHMAKRLALQEIKANPDSVVAVLRKALENAQADEELTLRINPQDSEFIEGVKKEAGNPLERIAKLHVETNDKITPGGCILETNYGVIDATVEQRLAKLWDVIEGKIPKLTEGA